MLPLALPLLQWLAPALMLDAWNATQSSVMRAHLRGRDVLRVILVLHTVHLALALPLMARFGLPGFAFALIASRALGVLLHAWLWRTRLGLRLAPAHWWRAPRAELGAVLAIGAPGALENILYRGAFIVSVAVVGGLGADALAAHAYTSQINHAVLLAGLATGLAVEIVLGHHIGAGRLRAADRLVRRALAIGLPLSITLALAAALGRAVVAAAVHRQSVDPGPVAGAAVVERAAGSWPHLQSGAGQRAARGR